MHGCVCGGEGDMHACIMPQHTCGRGQKLVLSLCHVGSWDLAQAVKLDNTSPNPLSYPIYSAFFSMQIKMFIWKKSGQHFGQHRTIADTDKLLLRRTKVIFHIPVTLSCWRRQAGYWRQPSLPTPLCSEPTRACHIAGAHSADGTQNSYFRFIPSDLPPESLSQS